ncbi:MAG: tRNA (adenosine(37)-N6)-threonylcarbamoyltransferase complex transferase subunit TsaD [bacterium]|nr:tRNA (adenosine(37)-N6)-threonylcarbamoyltransferase complex transferase subunit TsaD [bacterium]
MKILAIETSCDETSVAILNGDDVTHVTASQIDVHRITGGIVPEVAAREHVQVMIPIIKEIMQKTVLIPDDIDRIAVTSGPGLITSLMVGVETARTLAYSWNKPLFSINHIEGHIAANFIGNPDIEFPAVALVVSGGHTELLFVPKPGTYELIGATRDDAAGECFDKCARILGLDYPGGPEISKLAAKGDSTIHHLPSPMLDSDNSDFSFSGLKTAVLYFHRDNPDAKLEDVCASIENAIVNVLVAKTKKALKVHGAKSLLVGGGVAANSALRTELENLNANIYIPAPEFCTDNAAMIAAACRFHEQPTDLFSFKANPNWELTPR